MISDQFACSSVEDGSESSEKNESERSKTFALKETFPMKLNKQRTSLIPKLKTSSNEVKGAKKCLKFEGPSKISSTTSTLSTRRLSSSFYQKPFKDKKLQGEEITTSKCKNADISHRKPSCQNLRHLAPNAGDVARRMTSDTQVFTKIPMEDEVLYNFENSVRQISEVWLRTSADLSNRLKSLKNNPSLDPVEFQQESMKIQMVIQQAKSLTIVKTKNVMEEAKILLHSDESIRPQSDFFLTEETFKSEKESTMTENSDESQTKLKQNPTFCGMGDLPTMNENIAEYLKEIDANKLEEKNLGSQSSGVENQNSFPYGNTDEASNSRKFLEKTDYKTLEKISQELMRELSKRNDTITHLNNKIFQLQKACDEHLRSKNYLQVKLAEYHEKIQWNNVLWKQIVRLKARIRGFQESYANLEREKKALEKRVASQEEEIERINDLNDLLNQKKFLLTERENKQKKRGEEGKRESFEDSTDSERRMKERKILEEKQNAVNVLRMVMNVMKDQENLAQKQIAMFQLKIEELEKSTKI